MTFNQFLLLGLRYYGDQQPHLRLGQAYYNFLHSNNPDLALSVIDTDDVDPFYDDKFLPAFFAFVAIHWDDEPSAEEDFSHKFGERRSYPGMSGLQVSSVPATVTEQTTAKEA